MKAASRSRQDGKSVSLRPRLPGKGQKIELRFSRKYALSILEPGVGKVHRFPLLPEEGSELSAQPAGLPEQQVHLQHRFNISVRVLYYQGLQRHPEV